MIRRKLIVDYQTIVWKEIIISLLASALWHVQTLMLFKVFIEQCTLLSILVLLLKPTVQAPSKPGGQCGAYLVFMVALYTLIVVFQVAAMYMNFENKVGECDWLRYVSSLVSMQKYEFSLEDFLILFINIVTCIVTFKVPINPEWTRPDIISFRPETWIDLESFYAVTWMCAAGYLHPSLLSLPYFLCALGCGLAWAWNVTYLSRSSFCYLLRVIMVFSALHIVLFTLYQHPLSQNYFPPHLVEARLLGLSFIQDPWCKPPQSQTLTVSVSIDFIPVILLFTYYAHRSSMHSLRKHLESQKVNLKNRDETINEKVVPNIRPRKDEASHSEASVDDLILGALNNSIMMVWSVLYHSWLGFFMLVWANVMWIVIRQHRAMGSFLRALSIFASLQLVMTFVFRVDYAWPSHVGDVSLKQLGLLHSDLPAIVPLAVKSTFTLIFFGVLRQYTKPYVSLPHFPTTVYKKLLNVVCTMWIRIVIILVVVLNLHDTPMCRSLAFFLAISLFLAQLSPKLWKLALYLFMGGVLFMSEVKLTSIYLIQFDDASKFLEILNILDIWQRNFGASKLNKKDLLGHLSLPTLTAMLTAIFFSAFSKKIGKSLLQSWDHWMSRIVKLERDFHP